MIFSMITVDSTMADNCESIFGTGTNDLGNDYGALTNLSSGQVERDFGLFGNSLDNGNIVANLSDSNFDQKS